MMTREVLKQYLNSNLGDAIYTRQGLKYNCPKPGCDQGDKFNLEINIDRNIFNCWACHYSGFIRVLMEDYANDNGWRALDCFRHQHAEAVEQAVEQEEKVIALPQKMASFYLHKPAADYLIGERGMRKSDLVKRRVQYCYGEDEIYYNNIVFPFYEDGRLVGACLQDLKTKRYRNLGRLNFVPYKEFIDVDYPIVLGEGIYDVLPTGNGIPILNTEVNDQTVDFLRERRVVLGLDNTIDMDHFARQIDKLMNGGVGSLVILNLYQYKDMNEFYCKDKPAFLYELNKCFDESRPS